MEYLSQPPVIDPRTYRHHDQEEKRPTGENTHRLPKLLRTLGTITLLASGVVFATQGWSGLSGLARYHTFLGFTLVLAGLGLFCGLKLKEDKGARTLLGIATAFLPAHFTAIGAFLFACLCGTAVGLPVMFTVSAVKTTPLMVTLVVAFPIIVAVAYLGFSSFARSEARLLTRLYLIANSCLLIPSRDGTTIGLVTLAIVIAIGAIDLFRLQSNPILQTRDGMFVRAMLVSPALFIIVRQLLLYPITSIFIAALFAVVAVVFFAVIPSFITHEGDCFLVQLIGILAASASWSYLKLGTFYNPAFPIIGEYFSQHQSGTELLVNWLPIATIMMAMSFMMKKPSPGVRRLAAWIGVGSTMMQLLFVGGVLSAFICVALSLVTIVAAFQAKDRALLSAGVVGFATGLLYHLRYALDLYQLNPWLSLAILGVTTIVGASYLERNYGHIAGRIAGFRTRVSEW